MLVLCAVASMLAGAGLADLGPVPADTVRVYLVRHGQAFTNLAKPPDLPPDQLDRLTPVGLGQARAVAGALRGRGIELVLSSPAGRARETATIVAAAAGIAAPTVELRLRPLDLGRGPGGRALDWDERIADWKAGRDPVPDGGESLEQVGQRVFDLATSLRAGHAGRSVVFVAHSEVLGAFVGLLRGTPAAGRYPPGIDLGSITVADVGPDGLPTLRLVDHMPEAPAR